MRIQLLHFEGCPSWRTTADDLTALAEEFDFDWELVPVEADDDLTGLGFRGSPTLLVDGTDPFADGGPPFAFTCRVYATPEGLAGSPSRDQLREVLSRR
ncbi:MAG: thioredoxin family protein [Candidatus Nanopelagicales bacterium]